MTQFKKIVIDLNSFAAQESLNALGRFSLAFATSLAQAAIVNDFELYIVVKAAEQCSNLWLRDHFAGLLQKHQILCWSPPLGLTPVCEGADLTLRTISEHIRESVIAQVRPDLVIVTDLFCGWRDQSCASIGLIDDHLPVAVFLPGVDITQHGQDFCRTLSTEQWYHKKLLQLKRAHYWLDIEEISDTVCNQQYSLPSEKVYALREDRFDAAAAAIRLITNLAENCQQSKNTKQGSAQRRPRLAYVSPFPPEHTGIASYSAELLPELAKYYDVDVVVDQDEVLSPWINANARICSIAWFTKYGYQYDRVLYQIGNSPFHAHMWDLLERFPGVIVLHDIFLGDATYYRSEHGLDPLLGLPMRLYADHGYDALANFSHTKDIQVAIQGYPYSLCLIQASLGVVVHSNHAKALAAEQYGAKIAERFAVIPHLRVLPTVVAKQAARTWLGIDKAAFLVCSFGHIVSNKMYVELIDAWFASPLAKNENCLLVLVGASNGEYGSALVKQINDSGFSDRIKITGWADEAQFKAYLNAADLAVQLRKESRGESSGSVLDCMALGLPTICNAHGSMAELPADGIWQLKDEFSSAELSDALTTLWREPAKRQQLGLMARQAVQASFAPWRCAELYRDHIEAFYEQPTQARSNLMKSLVGNLSKLVDLTPITEAIERSLPNIRADRQLLVDITALAHSDLHTGIQRVARSVLKCLLESPPKGFRVEPVYTAFGAQGYFYARQFTKRFLQIDIDILADDPVLMLSEDIFLGLDLCLSDVYEQRQWFEQAQQRGALVYFVVYDLLPVTHPHWFPASEQPIFQKWLQTITEFDGVISISHATSAELKKWMTKFPRQRSLPFNFGVAHIGADIAQSMPTKGLPLNYQDSLLKLKSEITFLMVGTIEPRKGHIQVLDAFEYLWASGFQCQLVFVGKPGWNVTELVERIRTHPEINVRLFWFDGISDEFLDMVYTCCSCLLAASEAEGFGLPIIEAAQHGLPVLARDIPVFREIAKTHVDYFYANTALVLSQEIEHWIENYATDRHTKSSNLGYSSWSECTERYKEFLIQPKTHTFTGSA